MVLDAFFTGSLVATLSSIQEKILSQQLQDVNHVKFKMKNNVKGVPVEIWDPSDHFHFNFQTQSGRKLLKITNSDQIREVQEFFQKFCLCVEFGRIWFS